MADFDIVLYTPELAHHVAELQRRLWYEDAEENLEYLQWKYHRNPYAREPLIVLAMTGDRAIGMRGFFGARIEFGLPTCRHSIFLAGDLVVAEEWENRGLFGALMDAGLGELRRRGQTRLLSYGATNKTMLAQLAAGWRATPPLGQRRRHRCDAWFRRRQALFGLPKIGRLAGRLPRHDPARAFADLDRHAARRHAARRHATPIVWTDQPRIEEMAALIERLGHDGRIRQERSAEYLRWRLANPMHSRRYGYWDEDRLEGYLVLEAPRHNSQRVNVLDAEASRPDILRDLLSRFTEISKRNWVTAWTHCLPRDLAGQLGAMGFVDHVDAGGFGRNLPCIMVRSLDAATLDHRIAGVDLTDLDNWDMRRLYNM